MAGSRMMRAVQYSGYGGGADGLQQVEKPEPSPKKDEVLVKVEAVGINPGDWKIQQRMMGPFLPRRFPFVPGTDIAGEVVQVGSQVKSLKVGDKVISLLMFWVGGGLAEFAVAKEKLTVLRPPEISPAEAAGIPVAAMTALQGVTSIGTKFDGAGKGSNVLITAASGGIGTYAVQLAKLGGHHVTATCGARNMELVKSLGADQVVDYKTPSGEALTSPSGRKYDYIINCANSLGWKDFRPSLAENGKVCNLAPDGRSMIAALSTAFSRKKMTIVVMAPKRENLQILVEMMKEGKLKTVLDSKHAFANAPAAWAKSMTGHATGKIVVEM